MSKKQKSGLYRTKVLIGVDREGKPVNKYISAKSKAELEDKKRKTVEYYIDSSGMEKDVLFGEYAEEWFEKRKSIGISASSRQSYRTALSKNILPAFGMRHLRAIRPMELQQFLNQFAGMSVTKITVVTSALKGIFRSACADRILQSDPSAYLRKPPAAKATEKRALTAEERERIREVCHVHPQGVYLAVMYYLGVRPGEARGLMWSDIDWQSNVVRIVRDIDYKDHNAVGELKTLKSRRNVPLPEPLREILMPLRGLPNLFIISGELNHAVPLAKTSSERLWVELMASAGMVEPVPCEMKKRYRNGDIRNEYVPLITPHMLRHNYITMCWENGFDPYTTMKLVGHSSIKTTMDIYTHLSDKQMEIAREQVSKMFVRQENASF